MLHIKSLIGKRKHKDVKTLILNESVKTELEFKQLNSRELVKIKDQIRLKARKKKQENIMILTSLFLVLVYIIITVF